MPYHNTHSDDISLLTFKNEMAGYSLERLREDATAAFSVALLTLPQAMAYALLAGLPLTVGLFAAIYSTLLATFFGSSRHLIVGPSNAISILVQSGTAEILFTHFRGIEGPERDIAAMHILTQLTMLIGVVQILAALCKLGRLIQFVSHSVIIAYIAGTALAVIVNQLFTFLGIPGDMAEHSLYHKGVYILTHAGYIHWPTAIVGILTLFLLIVIKRMDKRIPAPVLSLAFASIIVSVINSDFFSYVMTEGMLQDYWRRILTVGNIGAFSDLIPSFAFPYFELSILNQMLPFAVAVALLSVMETTSVAKSLAANSGQRLSINQEIFGIGIGNFFSSLISALPISGSASRSALSYANGGNTRMASILSAIFLALIVVAFNKMIMLIPLAALSAILLVSAANIVQPRHFFLCLKATNSDAFVLWTTLLSCVFLRLDVAFYIGVALSITLYLKKAAIPQLVEYDIDESGELHTLDISKVHEHKPIRVIKVEGELFFGAADLFQTTLKTIAEDDSDTRVIILQLKNARDIDATSCLALHQLHAYLVGTGRYLVACGMTQQIWDVLSDSGLVGEIGKENLFIFDERHPHRHMVRALCRARQLSTNMSKEPDLAAKTAPVVVQKEKGELQHVPDLNP